MALIKYDPCNTVLGDFVAESDCLEEYGRIVAGLLFKVGFNIETSWHDKQISSYMCYPHNGYKETLFVMLDISRS